MLIAVSGATGYIASHIIDQLLDAGHRVRGTVRSLEANKHAFLVALAEAKGAADRLEFYEADLLREGSFDAVVQGCDAVMHTASPFMIGAVADPAKSFIEPAVKGTENMLRSVAQAPSVKRVVVTSSVAAVSGQNDERGVGHVFTEADWNLKSTLKEGPYSLSKRLAEEKAWEMAKEQDTYSLVTINPSLVVGPTLSGRNDSASVEFLARYLRGELSTGVPQLSIGLVDVRDVARAHLAVLDPKAQGRHIVSPTVLSMLEIANVLRDHYPDVKLPKRCVPKFLMYIVGPLLGGLTWQFVSHNVNVPFNIDSSKITKELNFEFQSVEKALVDMAECLVNKKIVTIGGGRVAVAAAEAVPAAGGAVEADKAVVGGETDLASATSDMVTVKADVEDSEAAVDDKESAVEAEEEETAEGSAATEAEGEATETNRKEDSVGTETEQTSAKSAETVQSDAPGANE